MKYIKLFEEMSAQLKGEMYENLIKGILKSEDNVFHLSFTYIDNYLNTILQAIDDAQATWGVVNYSADRIYKLRRKDIIIIDNIKNSVGSQLEILQHIVTNPQQKFIILTHEYTNGIYHHVSKLIDEIKTAQKVVELDMSKDAQFNYIQNINK